MKNKDKDNNEYPYSMCSLFKYNNQITFLANQCDLDKSHNIWRNQDKFKGLIDIKNNSRGYLDNYTSDFYFFTYNDISDFSREYSILSVGISNYYDTNGVSVTTNSASPFEFLDDVEIEEMKFLL